MQVTIIQSDLTWEDPTANRSHFEEKMDSISDPTDLIVLPEMFSTGFSMNARELSEEMHGPTHEWIKAMADKKNAAITGSSIITEEGRYFNRMLFVTPDGKTEYYDKRHCFTLAGEDDVYTPGKKRTIVSWRDWRINLNVCYDLRFPVWSRNREDYDVLINVASWPAPRIHAWRTLLRARAIENQCYIIGVNRIGRDGNGIDYPGQSGAIDFQGYPLAEASDGDAVVTVHLDKATLLAFREQYAFWRDGDDFVIQ